MAARDSNHSEAHSSLISEMTVAIRSRDDPPELQALCGGSSSQQLIARNLHALFSLSGPITLSQENCRDVELVIRSFMHELGTTSELRLSHIDSPQAGAGRSETSQSAIRLQTIRREQQATIDRLQSENARLQEEIHSLNDDFRIRAFQSERDRSALDSLSRDLLARDAEIGGLRERLSGKASNIESLERSLRVSALKVEELTTANQKLAAISKKNRRLDRSKTEAALSTLTETCEQQQLEISGLRAMQKKYLHVISIQSQFIDDLSARAETLFQMSHEFEAAKRQVAVLVQENCRFRDVLAELQNMTGIMQVPELPAFVKHLLGAGVAENRRFQHQINSVVAFLSRLTGSPFVRADPLELRQEIVRLKQFVADNHLAGADEEECADPTIGDVLHADLLTRFCLQLQDDVTVLRKVADIFHFSGKLIDFPGFVTDRLAEASDCVRKLRLLCGREGDPDFVTSLEADLALLRQFQEGLSDALEYTGEANGLPGFATESIKSYRRRIETEHQESAAQLQELRQQCKEECEKCTSRIEELERELRVSKQQVTKLSQSLELSAEPVGSLIRQEVEATTVLAKSYEEFEAEIASLCDENESLRRTLVDRSKQCEARDNRLLDEERRQHGVELNAVRTQLISANEKLQSSLQRKVQRNKMLKAKIREILDSYTAAFAQQKEVVAALKEENRQLRELHTMTERRFNRHLSRLKVENQDLQCEIDELREKVSDSEKARDAFWKSKVTCLETVHEEKTAPAKQALLQVDAKSLEKVAEWESWARGLYSDISHDEACALNAKELRFILSEMVISSISHHRLVAHLKSLRAQKALFVSKAYLDGTQKTAIDCRTLQIIGIAVTRLKKNLVPH
jgi:DNA repair exonuclease SbcCD ATPase subunit